jgi:hypothetical protein
MNLKHGTLAVLILLFSMSSHAQDMLVAVGAENSVWKIYKAGDCKLDSVIKIVPPGRNVEWRPAAVHYPPNKDYRACWWLAPNGVVYFIFEDGDIGMFDAADFRVATEI